MLKFYKSNTNNSNFFIDFINKIRKNYVDVLLFLPALIFLVLFRLGPALVSIYASLTEWSIISNPKFIGFNNYLNLFNDPHFITALLNTLFYALILIPSLTIGSLALALLVNSLAKGQNVFKTIYYLPMVIPLAIISVIWKIGIYSPFGFVNQILEQFGFEGINFLSHELAKNSISLTVIWRQTGYWALMYLAGLKNIPRSLYEAADVDGANYWNKFRYITLPMLKPITLLVMILTTIASFRVFAIVYTMTAGGPGETTKSLIYYAYQLGWMDFRMGYGSSVAVFFMVVVLLLNYIQKKIIGDADHV